MNIITYAQTGSNFWHAGTVSSPAWSLASGTTTTLTWTLSSTFSCNHLDWSQGDSGIYAPVTCVDNDHMIIRVRATYRPDNAGNTFWRTLLLLDPNEAGIPVEVTRVSEATFRAPIYIEAGARAACTAPGTYGF